MALQYWLVLHIIAFVSWFAGLLYLPRLFVYHATATDGATQSCFKLMEHKLYYYIMYPAMLLTYLSGIGMIYVYHPFIFNHWLQIKLAFVLILFLYHLSLGHLLSRFKADKNTLSSRFFRFYNEVPTLLLIIIVSLVILKPF